MKSLFIVLGLIAIVIAIYVPIVLVEYTNTISAGYGAEERLNGSDAEYAEAMIVIKYLGVLNTLVKVIFWILGLFFIYKSITIKNKTVAISNKKQGDSNEK